jgi:hypothetical protein
LARFIATAKYDHQHRAVLHVVHAPARPEKLAHFKHAITHGFDIAHDATLCFVKPHSKPNPRAAIAQASKPFIEFWQTPNDDHG